MFIDGWMDKENMIVIYSGIFSSFKNEGNYAICNNMVKSGGHYAK